MQCEHKVTWSQQCASKLKTNPRTMDRSTGTVLSNSGAIHQHGSKSWIAPLLDMHLVPAVKHVTCVGKMWIFTRIYIRILHVGTSADPQIRILPRPTDDATTGHPKPVNRPFACPDPSSCLRQSCTRGWITSQLQHIEDFGVYCLIVSTTHAQILPQ